MAEQKVIGLFKRSPRPKWRGVTGAMRSFTVARDFQKLTKKNVGKAGRPAKNSTTQSSSKSSSWMTSDEDDDDDDFAELSDFEIDEDECEKSRFASDTLCSCLSTDFFPNKAEKDWDEASVPFLSFGSAVKSTPIEKKQEPGEVSSEIKDFDHGVLASSTPKSNKIKNLNESESKLALELEGNILPMRQENPALDLKADLFDNSHKDVDIPEILMSGEKEIPFNSSNSPNIPSRFHQTSCSTSENKAVVNGGSSNSQENISFCTLEKPPKRDSLVHSLNTSLEDIEIPESIIHDEKGDPFNISNSLNNSSHLDETVCSKTIVPEHLADPTRPGLEDQSFDKILKNIKSEGKDETLNKSIYSITSGCLDEAPQTADSSSSFNKTLEPVDEKEMNQRNLSICMLTKLPKLGRKLAFRRKRPEKPTSKKIIIQSEEYALKNIPVCFLVTPPPSAMEDLSIRVGKTVLND